jgi:nucleoside-diphosphate-sugar epimerase
LSDKISILVTGATGFLGRHLIQFLKEQPDICVFGISKKGGVVGGIRVESVDLSIGEEVSSWQKETPHFDALFHLAAIVPASFYSVDVERLFFTNLHVTRNALSIAISNRASFIYASGCSVYGACGAVPITENMLPQPDNAYSLAKYVGELMCGVANARHGIRTTILRISAPYGPLQVAPTVINIFLRAALESKDMTLFGSGRRTQDFTYVGDVVQALWLAFRKKENGIYNIASGQPVTMRELAETILAVVPTTRSKIAYAECPDTQEGYRGIFAIEKARYGLGYEPRTSLPEGLRACLAAMKEEKSEA